MSVLKKIGGAFKFVAKQPVRGAKAAAGAIEDHTDRRTEELADIILEKVMIRLAALLDKLDAEDTLSGLAEDIADGVAGKYELVIPEIRIRLEKRTG